MTQFVHPQIWTRHAVLPDIRAGSPNKNISEWLGVNLKTVQRIWQEFGESNGDYVGTAAQETTLLVLIKKKTSEFVGEIKIMIDNDL